MSSNKRVPYWLMVPTLLYASACMAESVTCPERIETAGSLITAQPDWQVLTDARPQYFEKMSVLAGPPDQAGTLVPDVDTDRKVVWNLTAGNEYWLSCHYLYSNIRLMRRLPGQVKQCVVHVKTVGRTAVQQERVLVCK